jgi:hypothetical protein
MLIHFTQLNFGSESQIHCRTHIFSNELAFAAGNSISTVNHKFTAGNSLLTANANSLQETHFRQRITNSLQNTLLATNANSLQATQFQQRITNSL